MDSIDQQHDNDELQQSYSQSQASSLDVLQTGVIDFKRDITIIQQLKFQNTLYKAGEHIALRSTPNDTKEIYGQIMIIGKCTQTQFPLILLTWHYSKFQGFDAESVPNYLSDKELIASNHKDWQYVQSITRKITVLTLQQYQQLDYRQRQKSSIFFMRSRLDNYTNTPIPQPSLICHCLKPYNPDQKTIQCIICGFQFHAMCARHQYLCIYCQ